jgi:glucose-1-phosphate thymidylyltransferase
MSAAEREIVGIVPAAGRATRIAPLPCSKELYPIGFSTNDDDQGVRPKPVGQFLLEHFRRAGARRVFMILRKGKWDIPEYFGDGAPLGLSIAYLMMNLPHGVPYTVDQAHDFVREATVVFGFPDMLVEPEDAYPLTVAHLMATRADLVLGVFPTDQPHLGDPIEFDENGRIRRILVKPVESELRFTWALAAWGPSFTAFMHEFLAERERRAKAEADPDGELHMSPVIMAAIEAGLRVEALHLPNARFLDIGVPKNLVEGLRAQLDTLEPRSGR